MREILTAVLNSLREKRPVFHSEADLQHAFAWEMQQMYPEAEIRLEYPFDLASRIYLDLWATFNDGRKLALEMKYKTKGINIHLGNERFILANHGAQDCGRYDAMLDIQRVEQVTESGSQVFGAALFMTNDGQYWRPGQRIGTNDEAFRIHEGVSVSGERQWSVRTGAGTMRGREEPIQITGAYTINWDDYVSMGGLQLRYFLLTIPSSGQ